MSVANEGQVHSPPVRKAYAKNWCFTLNNYTPEDVEQLSKMVDEAPHCVYVLFGKEVGESGTPHLQGFLSFSAQRRPNQVSACFSANPHLEVARNVGKSISYCKKDGDFLEFGTCPSGPGVRSDLDAFKDAVKQGTLDLKRIREEHSEVYAKYTRFCLEFVQDHYPVKDCTDHELFDWQKDVKKLLDGEPDPRQIVFLVDEIGNSGKTWFAHWYTQKNQLSQVLLPGKKADMAYALDSTIRVLFVDAPRSKQGDFIQYDFLEDVKNGYVFSTKYESRVKRLSAVHVVVNMNEEPDMGKLSRDRYKIIHV